MPANQLAAVNDVVPINLPRTRNGTIIGQIDLNGAAGVTVELQVRVSSDRDWKSIKMKDPVADAMVSNLSTDEQIGWAENPGYTAAQWKLTALGSGGPVNIDTNAGEG